MNETTTHHIFNNLITSIEALGFKTESTNDAGHVVLHDTNPDSGDSIVVSCLLDGYNIDRITCFGTLGTPSEVEASWLNSFDFEYMWEPYLGDDDYTIVTKVGLAIMRRA